VVTAFGVFLLVYGLLELTAERTGGRSPRRSFRWPLVIGFCAAVVFNVASCGENERRQLERDIDAGIAELSAWEEREAARMPLKQYIGQRAGGRGEEACAQLTARLRRELLAPTSAPGRPARPDS